MFAAAAAELLNAAVWTCEQTLIEEEDDKSEVARVRKLDCVNQFS